MHGSDDLKIFDSRSSASLRSITLADHRLLPLREDAFEPARPFDDFFRVGIPKKEQGFPLFLPFREPIPFCRNQWKNLAYSYFAAPAKRARIFSAILGSGTA